MDDTISAAYVANVLETRKEERDLLPSAAYLHHLDDEPDAAAAAAVRLGSRESKIEEYVEVFRAHKQKIVDTATRADVDILDKWQSCLDERKLQFLFSRALSKGSRGPIRAAYGGPWKRLFGGSSCGGTGLR